VDALKTGDSQRFNFELQRQNVHPQDVLDADQFNQTLLFTAAQIRDEDIAIEMCTQLIKQGVDPLQKDSLKQTPLYYCAREGNLKLAKFFIDQGLFVTDVDTYGQDPIYYAVNMGQLEICKLFKEHGSEHDRRDENGETPLYYAIKSDRMPVLEYLLSLGCNMQNTNHRNINLVQWATR
jgi:ankyrin repeat protein